MTTRTDLEAILRKHTWIAKEDEWAYYDRVMDAVQEAYNRAIDDCFDKMIEATVMGTDVRYDDLKIKG